MSYRSNPFQDTTAVVKNLVIINVLVFLAQLVTGGTDVSRTIDLFALHHYKSSYFQPYQLVTFMFMHGSFLHLFFNMFALWMFGSWVERDWGPKRFLVFYFICGIGSGLFQLGSYMHDFWQVDHSNLSPEDVESYQALLQSAVTVGASGAIMGVLAAFGYLYSDMEMIVFPIPVPIKAKWAVTGMILIDVFGGVVKRQGDNVAHFAHIGGALIGLLLVLYWHKKNKSSFN